MKFKQFLNESSSQYKKEISEKEATEILVNLGVLSTVRKLYRGMSEGPKFMILEGEAGNRGSANTTNHYTVILDHFLKETEYPLRSKSIICTRNKGVAEAYGDELYVIIPMKDTKVASTNKMDIWDIRVNTEYYKRNLPDLNEIYDNNGINSNSYESIVKGIKDVLAKEGESRNEKMLISIFKNPESVEKRIKEIYTSVIDQFTLHKDVSTLKGPFEYWIGGKCLAIRSDVYIKFEDKVLDIID